MPVNIDQNKGEAEVLNSRLQCKNIYNNIFIRNLDVLPVANF